MLFKNLKIGQQFIFENKTWVKVVPVKKGASCCGKIIYNAHVVGDNTMRKVFLLDQEVQSV